MASLTGPPASFPRGRAGQMPRRRRRIPRPLQCVLMALAGVLAAITFAARSSHGDGGPGHRDPAARNGGGDPRRRVRRPAQWWVSNGDARSRLGLDDPGKQPSRYKRNRNHRHHRHGEPRIVRPLCGRPTKEPQYLILRVSQSSDFLTSNREGVYPAPDRQSG